MKYYTLSEKGSRRDVNEDSFLVEKNSTHHLFTVADGVGGLQHGNLASTYATAELKKLFIEGKTNLETCFHIINSNMVADNFEKNRTMASTLTAVLVNRESHSCEIVHIGDSRAYIINESIWHTKDHSLVQELLDLEIISKQEAIHHSEKHRLTQALGVKNHIDITTTKRTLQQSILLLCTDGLSDYLQDEEIRLIIQENELNKVCGQLMRKTLENGCTDDITIIIASEK